MATFEMLWNCSFCGAQKLLGKTHRRCPQCGAPQDAASRYFPAPGEEVLASAHQYVGVDWACAACTSPNSRAASFCGNCGNARAGNAAVARIQDAPPVAAPAAGGTAPPAAPPLARRSKWSRVRLVVGSLSLALLSFCVVAVCWQKDVEVKVEQHAWSRDIELEQLNATSDSSWCDSMPSDAYSVSRSRKVRSNQDVADGETCHTVRSDNGDGTFSTSEKCATKYRSEPVYDDQCSFTIDRWQVTSTAHEQGAGLSPERSWPALSILRPGSCRGCQRAGARRERLELQLRGTHGKDAGQTWKCEVDEARWQKLQDGDVRVVRALVVTGGPLCSTLVP